jgi:hypothetical protein
MINIFATNSNVWPFGIDNSGKAIMAEAEKVIPPPAAIVSNSVCVCRCEYTEKVFSEAGAVVNLPNNDKTPLLFTKQITADTISIYLCYGSTRTLITDDTYGLFYPAGYFSLKPLYVGFLADWNKIYNSLGAGNYWFEIDTRILGYPASPLPPLTTYSIYYDLKLFSDRAANKTFRIETYNTGVILSSQFDYASMLTELPNGWYQSYRIGGKLLAKTPKLTTDNYYDQNYKLIQIQDKITDDYELETHLIPASISNQLIYDNMLANKILLSDFNIYNEEVIRQISLYPTEIGKTIFGLNRNCKFKIKFTQKIDNTIKNNF